MTNIPNQLALLVDRYFSLRSSYQTLLWFCLILLIKSDTLFAPPVWDAVSGVFAPAIFLYENNFNIAELVKQETWWLGGPRTHTLSLWTWLVALIIYITKSPIVTYLILHLLTFGLTAVAFSTLLKCIDEYEVDRLLILIGGALIITSPLVLVQIGFIYTEIPVMCFSIFALSAWQKNNEGLAVVFAIIALSIKLTGLAIAVSIGLVLFFRFLANPTLKRVLLALSLLAFFVVLMSAPSWLGQINETHGLSWGKEKTRMFVSLYGRAYSIAEIITLIYIGLISSLVLFFFSTNFFVSRNINQSPYIYEPFGGIRMILISFSLVFFASIAFATYKGYLFLPRYILPMIPFAVISILLLIKALNFETSFKILFLIFCCFNIYNHNGALYVPKKSFGVAERSHHYQAYSQGYIELINNISELPDDVPIYVSRGVGYLVSHPMMGYLEKPKPNFYKIYRPEYISKKVSDFPQNYYLIVSTKSTAHGGTRIREILKEVKESPNHEVEELYNESIFSEVDMGIYHVQYKAP